MNVPPAVGQLLQLLPLLVPLSLGAADLSRAVSRAGTADELFGTDQVFHVTLEIPSASLQSLKQHPKEYIKARIVEGSQTYQDVGVRMRGNKKFQTIEQRPSLALKFNEFTSDTRFHGHTRLFLCDAGNDPTCLRKALGGEMFRAAGVPAPRIGFARLTFNGTDQGLYLIEQAVNREFLDDYFEKTKGNLYEGSDADVTDKLEKDSGGADWSQDDLKALAAAAQQGDPAQRLKELEAVLDVRRFLQFTAAEVFTGHRGYGLSRNNYRIYHDPVADKLIFMPHDLSGLFKQSHAPLLPEWKGLVARALLETEEGRRRYRDTMRTLVNTTFQPEPWQARVQQFAARIRPMLSQDVPALREFDTSIAQLQEQIAERARFLTGELLK